MTNKPSSRKSRTQWIGQSLEQIESQLPKRIDISTLSRRSYLSPFYYQRLFHSLVGDSVMEYVKKRRLFLAAQQLCETSRSILDIALDCGYESHEGFTRAFKAYHGVTPTECRKYTVYSSYDRIHFLQEGHIMPETRETLSQNITAILHRLNELIVQFHQAAEQSETAGQEPPLGNFSVIAGEIRQLAERTQSACKRLNDLRQQCQEDAFAPARQAFAVLKTLDDTCFQTHLIVFNARLQNARTSPEYQKKLREPVALLQRLEETVSAAIPETEGLFLELSNLIFQDIRAEQKQRMEQLSGLLHRISGTAGRTGQGIVETVKNAGITDDSLRVIGEETLAIASELNALAEEISILDISGGLPPLLHAVPQRMEAQAFHTSILAFNEKLDILRSPGRKELAGAASQLPQLAGDLHAAVQEADALVRQMEELARLLQNQPHSVSPSPAKQLDDLLYQTRLYSFYVKLERAKFQKIATKEQLDRLDVISAELSSALDQLRTFGEQPEPHSDSACAVAFRQHRDALERCSSSLLALAEDLGERGPAWRFLSEEFAIFAAAVSGK